MAAQIKHPVYSVFIGNGIREQTGQLLPYGVDTVLVYDYQELRYLQESVGSHSMMLMKEIEHTFDPKNILNPGKVCG